jgi:maltooligosyltrehalose trehalohydrolase
LEELSAAVDTLAAAVRRPLFLIAESDRNDPRTVTPREAGGLGLHAQCDDDVHHTLHALLTGESAAYYADFAADPYAAFAKVYTSGFFHDGTLSTFRGRHHGRPVDVARLPASRLVAALQTHDQVGNRAVGDRIGAALTPGLRAIGAALLLCGPFTPMLFMGEEWGAGTPWQYFTDHPDADLGAAVRDGRRREFAAFGWTAEQVPDPQAPETFARSRLDWAEPAAAGHAGLLAWYRELIALRHREPELTDPWLTRVAVTHDAAARRLVLRRGTLHIACNLAPDPRRVPLDATPTTLITASSDAVTLTPDAVELPPESVAIIRGPACSTFV